MRRAIVEDEGLIAERLLGRFGGGEFEVAHVGALFGGLLPALGLIAFHLVDDTFVRKRGGAGFGPDGIAVGVITVMVGIEDVADRFGGEFADVGESGLRAAREVGVNDYQIVFHLDDDVVAMALAFDVAFAKPDALDDFLDCVRLGIGLGDEDAGGEQTGESSNEERALHRLVS